MGSEKEKLPAAIGRPIAVDHAAKSASQGVPAFIARPAGSPVYHDFQILHDVSIDGFKFGKITDFEAEQCEFGDAFVIVPDDGRAGLVWEGSDRYYFREVCPIEADRWGVWDVSFSEPMTSRANVRKNLEAILPELKKRWQDWRRNYTEK